MDQKLVLIPVVALDPVDADESKEKLNRAAFAGSLKELVEICAARRLLQGHTDILLCVE
jgi:hypothetical protein